MIQFIAHKDSFFTATVEWWEPFAYNVFIFYPDNEAIIDSPSTHYSMKEAYETAVYIMRRLHERYNHDLGGEK